MTTDDIRRRLTLFNEKARYLQTLGFARQRRGFQVVFGEPGAILASDRIGPTSEQIDACVLTVRFFCQNNEGVSFQNMQDLYDSLPVSATLRAEFSRLRGELNAALDSALGTTLETDPPTRRALFDTVLYGTRAHANTDKAAQVERWRATSLWNILEYEFTSTLGTLVRIVGQVADVNDKVFAELDGGQPSGA